jgi:hypothetical protein
VSSLGAAATMASAARTAFSASRSRLRIADASAAFVIGRNDLSHVLGFEPRGKRGRADEIDNHHREMTAFGGVGRCLLRGGGQLRRGPASSPGSRIARSIFSR